MPEMPNLTMPYASWLTDPANALQETQRIGRHAHGHGVIPAVVRVLDASGNQRFQIEVRGPNDEHDPSFGFRGRP